MIKILKKIIIIKNIKNLKSKIRRRIMYVINNKLIRIHATSQKSPFTTRCFFQNVFASLSSPRCLPLSLLLHVSKNGSGGTAISA